MIFRPNRRRLNAGWRFRFEDDQWEDVTLPHTWNALDTMSTDPNWHYRRGMGIYELDFVPPENTKGQRLWLEFEAVSQSCKVYFNNVLLTEHRGGYTAFNVNIPNRAGTIRIEADNTPNIELIPSDQSDFFLYGGITRNVWLYSTYETWIDNVYCDIIATDTHASLTIHLKLNGNYDQIEQIAINLQGIGFHADFHEDLDGGVFDKSITVEMPIIEGDEYKLWSPDSPNLYRLQVALFGWGNFPDDMGGGEFDLIEEHIGFRYYDFPEYGPFYLNGARMLLKGTHRHEDWAGYGGAVPDEITRHEFQLIKDAGFNFVRLGHYPQSRAALEACDKLGIIVWEEIPWCRGGVGGELFKQQTRHMLHEMLDQHYNHASIIFWGLGNELDWASDHTDSTDDKVSDFLQELQIVTKAKDSKRLTALRRFDYGAHIVDVYSPSIWAGWYRGKYTDYEQNLLDAMAKFPRLVHAEWGGDSHVGRFRDAPHIDKAPPSTVDNAEEVGTATSDDGFTRYSKDGDWSESYILKLMDHHLMVQNKLPRFAGGLQWAFKDFGTPLRPDNPIPYVNQKGLLIRDGTPKANYSVFHKWNLDQTGDLVYPVDHCSTSVCKDFELAYIENQIWVTLLGEESSRTTQNDCRVHFAIVSGGRLLKYRGYMGASDTIETSNGRAWIEVIPDKEVTEIVIQVDVLGIGKKRERFTIDHSGK